LKNTQIALIEKHGSDELPRQTDGFHAYCGFLMLDIKPVLISWKDIKNISKKEDLLLRINALTTWEEFKSHPEEIVGIYGCADFTRKIMSLIDIPIPHPIDYNILPNSRAPIKLYNNLPGTILEYNYFDRAIYREKIKQIPRFLSAKKWPIFIKPVEHKKFLPTIIKNHEDYVKFIDSESNNISDETECWIQDKKTFQSEWRFYIFKKQIVGCANYLGDCTFLPDPDFVKRIISQYVSQPIAFTIDIGVINNVMVTKSLQNTIFSGSQAKHSVVIEANDFIHIGNYGGIPDELFAEMLMARLKQLREEGIKNICKDQFIN